MSASPLIDWMELTVNRLLALDIDTRAQFAALAGKVIRIECTAPPLAFFLIPATDGVRLLSDSHIAPDVSLRASLGTFLKLALTRTSDMSSLRAVEIEGDIELGQRIQRIWQQFDVDWEEQASHVVGDVVAHQAGNALRSGATWARSAVEIVGRDLAEFLRFEAQLLPPRAEIERFLQAVDTLRADTDRLQQRVQRLQQQ